MLHLRLVTGTLLVLGLIGLLWLDGTTDGIALGAFALLVLVPFAGKELAALLRAAGIAAPTWLTVLAAAAGVVAVRAMPAAAGPTGAAAIAATATWAVLGIALVAHTRGRRIDGVVAACGGTMLAFGYLGAMLGTWLLVRT